MNTATEAAKGWDALAEAEELKAMEAAASGLYAGAYTNRALTYRRCAESLRLEDQHGEPYCSCHLMPMRLAVKLRPGVS